MSTNDGGTSWQMDVLDDYLPLGAFFEVCFNKTGQAYAAGHHGMLLKKQLSVGVQEFGKEKSTIIYPNPARDIMNISLEKNALIKEVTIFNQTGQKVFEGRPQNNTIDVSGLKRGIYFVKVNRDNGIVGEKLVVVK